MFTSLLIARVTSITIASLMIIASSSPLLLAASYIVLRPLLYPYTNINYTFFGGIPLSGLLSMALIIPVFFHAIAKKDFSLHIRGQSTFYFFILASIPSIAFAASFGASIAMLIKLVTCIGFAILIYNAITKPKHIYIIFSVFSFSSIFPIAFAYYQKFTGFVWSWKVNNLDVGRIDSIFGRWNEYGIFLCLIICVLMSLILIEKKIIRKVFWIFLAATAVISLFQSLNRGSWIALTAASFLAYPFYFKKIKLRWFAFSFLLIGIFFTPTIISRFDRLEQKNEYGQSQNTLSGRIQYWLKIKELVTERPIVGWGLGNAQEVTTVNLHSKSPPHNDYLLILLETGIPGFIAWLLYLSKQFICALSWCTHQDRWRVNMPALICVNYFGIILLTQNIIINVVIFPLFMGIMAAVHRWNLLLSAQDTIMTKSSQERTGLINAPFERKLL